MKDEAVAPDRRHDGRRRVQDQVPSEGPDHRRAAVEMDRDVETDGRAGGGMQPRQRPDRRETRDVEAVLAKAAGDGRFADLQGAAAQVELTLLESVAGRERLYAGDSIEAALATLEDWTPRDGLRTVR